MKPRRLAVLVLGLVSGALAVVSFHVREDRNTSFCQSNLKHIGMGFLQYIRDYDEKAVLSDDWKADLRPYRMEVVFDCPAADYNYAFNGYISGISDAKIVAPQKTPLFFDSTSTLPNASDFGGSYPENGAHPRWRRGRGTNVAFYDGHVEWMQRKPFFLPLNAPAPIQPKKGATKVGVLRGSAKGKAQLKR